MHKRTTAIIGSVLTAFVLAGIVYVASPRFLQGSLLSDSDIAQNLKQRSDTNADGVLTAREIRKELFKIIRGVILHSSTEDINGDAVVDRLDISATVAGFRALLSAVCGNSVVDAGEQCDDGNTLDGDGCTRECKTSVRWSMKVQPLDSYTQSITHCTDLMDQGFMHWQLPTLYQMQSIRPELLRAGVTSGAVWTTTFWDAYDPQNPNRKTVVNLNDGTISYGEKSTGTAQALCVNPTAIAEACIDQDAAPSGFFDQRQAIFTASSVTKIHGLDEHVELDRCDGDVLHEQTCNTVYAPPDGDYQVTCPYGCSNQVCLRDPPEGFAWPYPSIVTNGSADTENTKIGLGLQKIGALKIFNGSVQMMYMDTMVLTLQLKGVTLNSTIDMGSPHIFMNTDGTPLNRKSFWCSVSPASATISDGQYDLECHQICTDDQGNACSITPLSNRTFTVYAEVLSIDPAASDPFIQLSWTGFNDPFSNPNGLLGGRMKVKFLGHNSYNNSRAIDNRFQYWLPAIQATPVKSTRYVP